MASLRHQRRKNCGTKVRWDTLGDAAAEAARLRRFRPGGISGYQCQYCSGYHVGHTPSQYHQGAARTLAQVTSLIERNNR